MPESYAPPSGPPPGYQRNQNEKQYAPPSGPPPGYNAQSSTEQYAPPQGPPPGHSGESYAPPSGPPPSHLTNDAGDEPPPYDPWLAVPDNALLPPPPSLREERSPTTNATRDDAIRGHEWCDHNPLWNAARHDQATVGRISHGDLRLTSPPKARNVSLRQTGVGRTHVRSEPRCQDSLFLSDIPLYAASNRHPQTIYYELHVIAMGHHAYADIDAGIAIGFLAPPYPAWRLPGWHRASLGVHGDDGRRYLDNSYGGRDFTQPFQNGDVVGIGMKFSRPTGPQRPNDCEIFFTRNGKIDGHWQLYEEKDQEQEDGDVKGLEGLHDLLAGVGIFGPVGFEVRFRREDWLFKP